MSSDTAGSAASLVQRLQQFVKERQMFRHDPSGWHELVAADFYRATGIIAPGKSVPLEMGAMWTEDERQIKWTAFVTARSEAYERDVSEAAALLAERGAFFASADQVAICVCGTHMVCPDIGCDLHKGPLIPAPLPEQD